VNQTPHFLANMRAPWLVTTATGVVHWSTCPSLRPVHVHWPWDPRNDGPGVARACRKCLPDGLPEAKP
jgi:hypothetical protein